MRFPLSLTTTMAGYIAKKKLTGTKRFPLVLMLEPLHACNLTCTGCGRIREYETTIKQKLSVEECWASVDECGAPIVSICGGEPMIYPEIGRLVRGILQRRKHIYLCTNGMFIKRRLHEFRPTSRFFFNVHLDGMEETHDKAVEREGGHYRVKTKGSDGRALDFEMDDVIAATGFTCPLRDLAQIGVATFGQSHLPAQTPFWGSATVPGIYFAGTIMQGSQGLRKHGIPSNSGAVCSSPYHMG